ncbi:MAG: hypothetical protein GY855_03085 [candidate division Zixibacteria bacterium]|nr:hypothetical protein [candidate division Zixibacteria bacterium]
MPFHLYEFCDYSKTSLKKVGGVQLAGENAIKKLWKEKGAWLEKGWHIKEVEILKDVLNVDPDTHRIIIELNPSSKEYLYLLELEDIFGFTYENEKEKGKADWTPLMLRLKDVCSKKLKETDDRQKELERFEINAKKDCIYEFLYLHGEKRKWNWGRVGGVNGALLHKHAREYFKKKMI